MEEVKKNEAPNVPATEEFWKNTRYTVNGEPVKVHSTIGGMILSIPGHGVVFVSGLNLTRFSPVD